MALLIPTVVLALLALYLAIELRQPLEELAKTARIKVSPFSALTIVGFVLGSQLPSSKRMFPLWVSRPFAWAVWLLVTFLIFAVFTSMASASNPHAPLSLLAWLCLSHMLIAGVTCVLTLPLGYVLAAIKRASDVA